MFKRRVYAHLFSQFTTAPSFLRRGASHILFLNFYNSPQVEDARAEPPKRDLDMSEVPDYITQNLCSLTSVVRGGLVWRTDLEYLSCFPVTGTKTGTATIIPCDASWVDVLLEKERIFTGVNSFFYTVIYHTLHPEVQDYTNFKFSYSLSILKGTPAILRDFTEFVNNDTSWADKGKLLYGISP